MKIELPESIARQLRGSSASVAAYCANIALNSADRLALKLLCPMPFAPNEPGSPPIITAAALERTAPPNQQKEKTNE